MALSEMKLLTVRQCDTLPPKKGDLNVAMFCLVLQIYIFVTSKQVVEPKRCRAMP